MNESTKYWRRKMRNEVDKGMANTWVEQKILMNQGTKSIFGGTAYRISVRLTNIECNLIFCQSIHTQMIAMWLWWEWRNIEGTHSHSYIISGRIQKKDCGLNYLNTLYIVYIRYTNTKHIIAPECTFMSTINLRTPIHPKM